jgi:hypothetical protein
LKASAFSAGVRSTKDRDWQKSGAADDSGAA